MAYPTREMDTLIGWEYEEKARADGFESIAGVDEAGRGPLAGPVVAAAVILPIGFDCTGISDSKKLSDAQRRRALVHIRSEAVGIGVGIVDAQIIDSINILQAAHLAMKKALQDLQADYDFVLVDGLPVSGLADHCRALVKGDSKSVSIAAASIVAKVTRDDIMLQIDKQYPEYGFAGHKGYGTKAHLQAIRRYGPCPHHRLTFSPLKEERSECVLLGLD